MGSLRDAIKTALSPPWLSGGIAEKYIYNFGLALDAILDKLNQGMVAHIPTYGDASALPLIAKDRLIPQGFFESQVAFAQRLKTAYDDWQVAGDPRSVLRQVLGMLSPFTPMARTVTEWSVWNWFPQGATTSSFFQYVTYKALGTPQNWVWDNSTPNLWWRFWTILYTPSVTTTGTAIQIGGAVAAATNAAPIQITTTTPHGLQSGASVTITDVHGNTAANGTFVITVIDALNFTLNGSTGNGAYTTGGRVSSANAWAAGEGTYGDGDVFEAADSTGNTQKSIGLSIPSSQVASIRSAIGQWKGAHSWCRWIIVSFDQTLFDPSKVGSAGGVNPDPFWGTWSKNVGGVMVPSRAANARYCDGIL